MAATVLEVKDISSRLLVVPSRKKPVTSSEMAAFNARLAPIEMNAPSVHLVAGLQKQPLAIPGPPVPGKGEPIEPAPKPLSIDVPRFALPLGYGMCGLILALCTLLSPDSVVACTQVLCPLWTLVLALHALADGEIIHIWLGCLTAALLPVILLVRDPLFVCFYLLVFGGFASGRFWRSLHGFAFVGLCISLFGLVTACVLSVLADHPRAQLSVAAVFALGVAVVSSATRFKSLRLTVASGL